MNPQEVFQSSNIKFAANYQISCTNQVHALAYKLSAITYLDKRVRAHQVQDNLQSEVHVDNLRFVMLDTVSEQQVK